MVPKRLHQYSPTYPKTSLNYSLQKIIALEFLFDVTIQFFALFVPFSPVFLRSVTTYSSFWFFLGLSCIHFVSIDLLLFVQFHTWSVEHFECRNERVLKSKRCFLEGSMSPECVNIVVQLQESFSSHLWIWMGLAKWFWHLVMKSKDFIFMKCAFECPFYLLATVIFPTLYCFSLEFYFF